MALAIIGLAVKHLPTAELSSSRQLQHRVGFALFAMVLLWTLEASLNREVSFHFFLASTLHLVFGWHLAMLIIATTLALLTLFNLHSIWGYGLNLLISGFVPVLVTFCVWRWTERTQKLNPFVFILLIAFGGGVLSVLVSMLVVSLMLLTVTSLSLESIVSDYWAFIPLLALPEGVINGMLIAGLIVFRPEWVRLYDEKKYTGS